jgi:type I restriction enzyme S subunit
VTDSPAIGLQYLVRFRSGQDYKQVADETGEVPVIGSGGPFAAASTHLYDGESVLFGRKGTIDRPLHVNGKFWTVDTMFYTELSDAVYGRWLYYWATTVPYDLYSTDTALPSMTSSTLGRLKVPVLSGDSQRAIATQLDRETGKIDAMTARIDELTRQLRHRLSVGATLLVFGFERDQVPQTHHTQSVLYGLPDHWDRTKFGYDFTESTERNGTAPPGPLLSISEYRGVELNTRTEGQQASIDVSKYRVVRPGQLAANMMWLNHGGLGVSSLTGYISPDYKAFWISDRFEPRYVHHLFRSSRYIDYFAAIATGVRPNAQRVTKTVLDATPVPLPPLEEQIRIADELDETTARVDAMLAKVADLKSLLLERRAALITDVVTGQKGIE